MSSDLMELWLNKATNPLLISEDWESIVGFCDLVNKEVNGPQTAVRLLVHKMQSPQEKESLYALTTLETCVKNCGARFHQEVGKFRFINEIIKLVSPKYLGNHTTFRVKQKSIELLYHWSMSIPQEPKIKEAYQMLRKQGIVKQDPVYINEIPTSATATSAPTPPQKKSLFEDEDKSKLLSSLLKSKNAEDLQAANRLIKNMVKQDAERSEKQTQRVQQLDTLLNSVRLLSDMLYNYHNTNSSASDKEIMKELLENIEKQRPALFKLANESDEKDATIIGEILKVNDQALEVIGQYDQIVNKSDVGNLLIIEQTEEAHSSSGQQAPVSAATSNGIKYNELSGIFTQPQEAINGASVNQEIKATSHTADLLDIFSFSSDQMPILPFNSSTIAPTKLSSNTNLLESKSVSMLETSSVKDPFIFGQNMLVDVLSSSGLKPTTAGSTQVRPSLNQLKTQSETSESINQNKVNHPDLVASNIPNMLSNDILLMDKEAIDTKPTQCDFSLKNITVPIEDIQIGQSDAVMLYDEQGLKVLLHLCTNKPKPFVDVVIVSVVSTSRVAVNNLKLRLVGEQESSVLEQVASATHLPAYNPILTSPSLSQIFIISNPSHSAIKLKSILDFQINSNSVHIEKDFTINLN